MVHVISSLIILDPCGIQNKEFPCMQNDKLVFEALFYLRNLLTTVQLKMIDNLYIEERTMIEPLRMMVFN